MFTATNGKQGGSLTEVDVHPLLSDLGEVKSCEISVSSTPLIRLFKTQSEELARGPLSRSPREKMKARRKGLIPNLRGAHFPDFCAFEKLAG